MSQALHGGAFFDAIGVDLRHLERVSEVVSADVLDAWLDPSPCVIATLREHLPFLLRTSPPSHAEGFVAEISAIRIRLLAPAVVPDQSHFSALRLQRLSHRRATLHGRTRDD